MVRGKKKKSAARNCISKKYPNHDSDSQPAFKEKEQITTFFQATLKPLNGTSVLSSDAINVIHLGNILKPTEANSNHISSDSYSESTDDVCNGENGPVQAELQRSICTMSPSSAISKLSISGSPHSKSNAKSKPRRRLNTSPHSKQITDFFPVRRSVRKTHANLLKEQQIEVEEAILSGREEGLEVAQFSDKGRGIIATKPFKRGEFVVEYVGDLVDIQEAKKRELHYCEDQNTGCYMYFFKYNNKDYCIDATAESNHLGRLINHSKLDCNLVTKSFVIKGVPHLILVAKRDIQKGEELLYDYGDRSRLAITWYPWLAS